LTILICVLPAASRAARQCSASFAAVEEIRADGACATAVVTHGKLLTLLLKHFDPGIGFADGVDWG